MLLNALLQEGIFSVGFVVPLEQLSVVVASNMDS